MSRMLAVAVCLSLMLAVGPGRASGVLAEGAQTGLELRRRHNVAIPAAETTIHIYSIAEHHSRSELSVIAWRAADGQWTISTMGQDTWLLLPPPGTADQQAPSLIPEQTTRLSRVQGRRLDRLLGGRALYAQPSPGERNVGIGAPFHTMEIVAPHGRKTFVWAGRINGAAGQVADVIIGRDS